jgi:hypothetical protein
VDDLVENVEAARAAGLIGTLYVGIEPLKVALKDAGVRAGCESV